MLDAVNTTFILNARAKKQMKKKKVWER